MNFRDLSCTKLCASCGASFARDKRCTWKHWEKAKFCSRECYGKANARRLEDIRLPMLEKFSQQVRVTDGCWEWTGLKDKDGYGLFPYMGIQHRANKIALELDGRPVPTGMYACHHCDNPPCVRPDHLYPGTPKQNMADAVARKRMNPKTKLTADEVRAIRREVGTHEQIAKTFNISRANVSLIREGRTWRNLL
jgi:hypothetical protein